MVYAMNYLKVSNLRHYLCHDTALFLLRKLLHESLNDNCSNNSQQWGHHNIRSSDSSTAISFGSVYITGSPSVVRTLTIKNLGTADLIFGSTIFPALSNAVLSWSGTGPDQTTPIAPKEQRTFHLQMTCTAPTSASGDLASIEIANNDGDENPFVVFVNWSAGVPSIAVKESGVALQDDGM